MKAARFFAMAILAASIPVVTQEAGAQDAGDEGSQKAVYAPQGPMGFGDASASHSWEMSPVIGELQDKLNSATAKVGDHVVLKTTEKVMTADGTVIPRGTQLLGHITQVQTCDATHRYAQLAIAFDHAELKNGQSIAIFTLIRGVNPSSGVPAMNPMNRGGPISMGGMDESTVGGTTTGGGRGGRGGGQPSTLGDGVQRTPAPTTSPVGDRAGDNPDPNPQGAVMPAGNSDADEHVGAHQRAAARAVPRPTAIPGVMLAGNSTASGVFLASMKDIQFASGTQMQLGITADR